jgi:hypothetical protein
MSPVCVAGFVKYVNACGNERLVSFRFGTFSSDFPAFPTLRSQRTLDRICVTRFIDGRRRLKAAWARIRQAACISCGAFVVMPVAHMNRKKIRRSSLVEGEIRSRWPSLPKTALDSGVKTPHALAVLLSEQLDFCKNRALMEAHGFWKYLEERFRLAA